MRSLGRRVRTISRSTVLYTVQVFRHGGHCSNPLVQLILLSAILWWSMASRLMFCRNYMIGFGVSQCNVYLRFLIDVPFSRSSWVLLRSGEGISIMANGMLYRKQDCFHFSKRFSVFIPLKERPSFPYGNRMLFTHLHSYFKWHKMFLACFE